MDFKIKDINNNLYVGVDNHFIVMQHIYSSQLNSIFDRSEFREGIELFRSDITSNAYYNLVVFR